MPEHFEDIDIEKLSKNRGRARSQTKASNLGRLNSSVSWCFASWCPGKYEVLFPARALATTEPPDPF
jgi:hypothetical protein